MARLEGLEPSPSVLETDILPIKLSAHIRCFPRTAATPDGTALRSGASPGMLVRVTGFEPSIISIKSRVPYLSATRAYWRRIRDSNTELRVLQTAILPFD